MIKRYLNIKYYVSGRKKYEKEVKAKDPYVILKIQNELLKMAEDELKDDPSMDIYRSGAK